MKQKATVLLILTTAIAIAGEVLRAGTRVEVTEDEAKDLLGRGRAELCEDQNGATDTDPPADTKGAGDADKAADEAKAAAKAARKSGEPEKPKAAAI